MTTRCACPTIATPMQTGDGLLARIIPQNAVSLDAFCALCAAAEDYGNGIIEVTQRGSLQIRGLNESSAPIFARVIASLHIAAESGPPILTSPLLGLDPHEPFDATDFVSSLQQRLRENAGLISLGPKVSVLVDGGGSLHLDAIAADVRLVASSETEFRVGMAGDANTATDLGYVPVARAVEKVEEVLLQIASLGTTARAKDLVKRRNDAAALSDHATVRRDSGAARRDDTTTGSNASTGSRLGEARPPTNPLARPPANPLVTHRLNTGQLARGIVLPFGHSTADALRRLARAAADNGATSIRPAPGRSLLAIGLSQTGVDGLCKAAEMEGFVVDAEDARRHVVACAGAPACASAQLPTRQLAPDVARAAQSFVGTSNMVHLSGCSKGCAHPGTAALTIVGPGSVILNGRASDKVYANISPAGIAADITKYCNELAHV